MLPMAMWTCDLENCDKSSVRTYGECIICKRYICATHLDTEYHICPKWEDEKLYDPAAQQAERKGITHFLSEINISALLSRASHLRHGVPCFLPQALEYDRSTRSSVMRDMNYHIEIQSEDGVSWLACIQRVNATSPPVDIRDYIMHSEVATLQFLSKTRVPAPDVFEYSFDEGNPIVVGYILMEKMTEKSLCWPLPSMEQRQISQLVDIFVELQTFPFDLMGSLDQSGTDHIAPFARELLMDYRDSYATCWAFQLLW